MRSKIHNRATQTVLAGVMIGMLVGGLTRLMTLRWSSSHEAVQASTPSNGVHSFSSTPIVPSAKSLLKLIGPELESGVIAFLRDATFEQVVDFMSSLQSRSAYFPRSLDGLVQLRAMQLDPPAYLEWKRKHPTFGDLDIRLAYEKWLRVDPEAALNASKSERTSVRKRVLQEFAKIDFERALALMRDEWPDSRELSKLESKQLSNLAKDNPLEAMATALETEGKDRREERIWTALNTWTKKDPEAAWNWLQEQENPQEWEYHFAHVALAVSLDDPAAGFEKLDRLQSSRAKRDAEGNIVRRWAERDLGSALEFALSQDQPERRAQFFGKLSRKIVNENPEKLLELVDKDPLLVGGYDPNHWSVVDSPVDHLQKSDGPLMSGVVAIATKKIGADQPMKALGYLGEHGFRGTAAEKAIQSIGSDWANDTPVAAADWAASLPAGWHQDTLQTAVMNRWATDAPKDAANYLYERGLTGNAALVREVVRQWATKDPEAAEIWRNKVQ